MKDFFRSEAWGWIRCGLELALIVLIETGLVGERREMADMGLTAMIVVLAVSLVGSIFFKR